METVSKKPVPTGSFILDEIARMLAANVGIDAGRIARRLGASEQDVQGFFRILTGMNATDFIGAYRILRAKEWLTCTDLSIGEIHKRCGFSTTAGSELNTGNFRPPRTRGAATCQANLRRAGS